MFRKFGIMLVAACLLLPFTARAEQLGVYVAPKFVLNIQHFKGTGSDFAGDRLPGSGSKDAARAGGALAVGYDFAPAFDVPVRAELEYAAYGNSSRHHGFIDRIAGDALSAKHTVRFQTLLANVYWDVTEWNGLTPYVGLGVGVAFLMTEGKFTAPDTTSASWHDTDTVFAGQVGLGISYSFTGSVSADLGYRFLMMDKGEAGEQGLTLHSRENYAHQVMLGLRVTF